MFTNMARAISVLYNFNQLTILVHPVKLAYVRSPKMMCSFKGHTFLLQNVDVYKFAKNNRLRRTKPEEKIIFNEFVTFNTKLI